MSAAAVANGNVERLMDVARVLITDVVLTVLPRAFPESGEFEELRADLQAKMAKVAVKGQGDLALPCFLFAKKIKGPPAKTAEVLGAALTEYLAANPHKDIVGVKAAGPYLNFTMSVGFVAGVLTHIQSGAYLKPRAKEGHPKVMIEYSQPVRTHDTAAAASAAP